MSQRRRWRCGEWPSPVSAATVAAAGLRLSDLRLDGDDVYWVEGRPAEGGRSVVVRRNASGRVEDVLPAPYSARSGVHEYGGGALAVRDGTVYFTNRDDQRIHRVPRGGTPAPITTAHGVRHADLVVEPGGAALLCVVERHDGPDVTNLIGRVPAAGGGAAVVTSGHDFYAAPRPSPDGRRLAWLQWDQPRMPWDGCELWLADVRPDGSLHSERRVAGGAAESICQPEWSGDGVLHFVSDRTGWWNLYSWEDGEVRALAPMDAECGRPMWVFGLSTYTFLDERRIALCAARNGLWQLLTLERSTGHLTSITPSRPLTEMGLYIRGAGERLVLIGGGGDTAPSVIGVDPGTGACEILRGSSGVALPNERLSVAEPFAFPTRDGATGHAFLYPPRPGEVEIDPDEAPPLLVRAHGGPTSAVSTALDPAVQYWTTRGFAVLDVDYAGSSGYGRPYRQRLDGRWGVADVEDCVDAASAVAGRGLADPHRLLITGGSAGGYVVLCALAFHDLFAGGASHYGVADPAALAADTHKFEARYLDGLIGSFPGEEGRYRERSPLHHTDRFRAPVILFQGLEDAVVPPQQAETMFNALRSRGVPCVLLEFEGEQHGFRRQETIRRVLEAELGFYATLLGLSGDTEAAPR